MQIYIHLIGVHILIMTFVRMCGTFKIKSRLSQHERYVHPNIRNAARAGRRAAEGERKLRKGKAFMIKKERLMFEMEVQYIM